MLFVSYVFIMVYILCPLGINSLNTELSPPPVL